MANNTLSRLLRRLRRLTKRHDPRRELTRPAGARQFAREIGVYHLDLAGIILEVRELRPIVEAIRARPNSSLLVFGCGHDSVFWEKVNRKGRTVFLEDNPLWAERTQKQLRRAQVHCVQYSTRRSEWRDMLVDEKMLAMDLPSEVAESRWDVILVDGPTGFDDETPGRMKSIYAASRLASLGTRVFVHDCERPVENAFTNRYLGTQRLFLEIEGRATLRGYRF
jgi:hypothetical protein